MSETLALNALLEVEVFDRDNLPLDNLSKDHPREDYLRGLATLAKNPQKYKS